MRLLLAFLCLASAGQCADALADLKTTLARLDSRAPIRARVVIGSTGDTDGDAKAGTPPTVEAVVEDGPAGLSIFWSRALLDSVAAEKAARNRDAGKPTPTRNSLEELKAGTLGDYLNAPALLLRLLDQARFTSEETTVRDGLKLRLLHLKLTPQLTEKDKKYIKEFEATAKLWLGADGLPVAAETQLHAKGRAMLVISFETTENQSYQFAQVGGRLMVVRHENEVVSSGAGETGRKKSLITLHPLDK